MRNLLKIINYPNHFENAKLSNAAHETNRNESFYGATKRRQFLITFYSKKVHGKKLSFVMFFPYRVVHVFIYHYFVYKITTSSLKSNLVLVLRESQTGESTSLSSKNLI